MYLLAQFPVVPLPVYPELHVHVNDPTVSVQNAFTSQLFKVASAHSLTSSEKWESFIDNETVERDYADEYLHESKDQVVLAVITTDNYVFTWLK